MSCTDQRRCSASVRVREARADAISGFAVRLGLLTAEQVKQILEEFYAAHPELAEPLNHPC